MKCCDRVTLECENVWWSASLATCMIIIIRYKNIVTCKWSLTSIIFDFSNGSNWLATLFLLMDMSILTKGPNHVLFDQST
jgi:hypothetical protein